MAKKSKKNTAPAIEPPPPLRDAPAPEKSVGFLPRWTGVTALVLFVAASFYGVLEVHSSTDTWIGLAGAQRIMTQPEFPTTDTFSFTFYGKTWFNQNWLSHVYLYLLYDHIGPNWVIYGTWALGWGVFVFVLLAIRLRCGSWLVATLAAALIAMSCRDWLSARPATMQFFLLSAAFLCITGLLAPGAHRRWWPIVGLALIFLVWPHAHGSFIFGYGLIGMMLGTWLLAWLLKLKPTFTTKQAVAVLAVVIVTGILGAALSPYGIDNYTHPFKVTDSEIFRLIGEWRPPTQQFQAFPPVYRFWKALSLLAACPLIAVSLIIVDRLRGYAPLFWAGLLVTILGVAAGVVVGTTAWTEDPVQRFWASVGTVIAALIIVAALRLIPAEPPPQPGAAQAARPGFRFEPRYLQTLLFDLGCIFIGLYMVMFARRFAPLFYIIATPALVTTIVMMGHYLSGRMRGNIRDVLVMGALVAGIALGRHTWDRAYYETYGRYPNTLEASFLERVTMSVATPRKTLEFLSRNDLRANVFAEWKTAGLVMFFAPNCRVYIDGRSQQVYDEDHYLRYDSLISGKAGADQIPRIVAEDGADTVLGADLMRRLTPIFDRDRNWITILRTARGSILMRVGSQVLDEVARRERDGTLWWPDDPGCTGARGTIYAATMPRDLQRASELWQQAIDEDVTQAYYYAIPVVNSYLHFGQFETAAEFVQTQRQRVAANAATLREGVPEQIMGMLARAEQYLAQYRARQDNRPGGAGDSTP